MTSCTSCSGAGSTATGAATAGEGSTSADATGADETGEPLPQELLEKMLAAKMIDQNRFDEDKNQFELAQVELKSSEEALRRANAVLSEAREQMGKTDIRAPISGKIVSLPIKVGETAIPSTSSLAGAQLMQIADTSDIKAELKVDEADIAKIAIGQKTDVFAAAYPETPLAGKVEKIALAPSIEGQGRAYKVTISLEAQPKLLLRSGMSARANIFLSDGSKKVAVPVEAVSIGSANSSRSALRRSTTTS